MNAWSNSWRRISSGILCSIWALSSAQAQLAPTGDHYAGRTSDTGQGGSMVTAAGVVAASIPIDLPSSRGGVPLPLHITHTGSGVGAAGLGWDVSISTLQQNRSFSQRRPRTAPGTLPSPLDRVRLSLNGQQLELIRNGGDWIARLNAAHITARMNDAEWLVYDGSGNTYRFVRPPSFETAGLWLLKSIVGTNGNRVELTYQIGSVALPGGSGTSVNLQRITFNTHPATGCAKHDVELTYGHVSPVPLAMKPLANGVLARNSALTLVDVRSRASCFGAFQRLRRYQFDYQPDTDTQLPRLTNVRMFGRQGSLEENVALPIATFRYGSATHNDRLEYRTSHSITLPAGVQLDRISGSEKVSTVNAPISDPAYATWQSLTDLTGNGRPDLVFEKNDKLWIAHNSPGANSTTSLGIGPLAVMPLTDATLTGGPFSSHTNKEERYAYASTNRNTTNVWRQAIDVNGDGRIDIIDAAEKADHWIVYLNTPGGPSGVNWKRRSFQIKDLRLTLTSRGHKLAGNRVPLSRRATGSNLQMWECWRWNGSKWVWYPQGFANHACPGNAQEVVERGPERSIVEWELRDLNGDSYPDFVFNSTPVDFQPNLPNPHDVPNIYAGMLWPVSFGSGGPHWRLFMPKTNSVRAALNVRGTRFDVSQKMFAASFELHIPAPYEVGVGVSEWRCSGTIPFDFTCPDETKQSQFVGFADVNGDGVADRINGRHAYLGLFHGTALSFSPVHILLPGPIATTINTNKLDCTSGGSFKPTSNQVQGLRDLTGDGIPDYVDNRRIWIGTGAGFRASIPITVPTGDFSFSHQTETCDGRKSNTDGGLYDINADGKADIIGLVGNTYRVSELVGGQGPGIPDAGRITAISNGYGARSDIHYVSAKHLTNNPVPFPEIVATKVLTYGTSIPGQPLNGSLYAYSNAELIFDGVADRFVFPGYRRRVEVSLFDGPFVADPNDRRLLGAATITDTWPLTAFNPTLTKKDRWLRVHRAGQLRDIYTLRGTADPDAWSLLNVGPSDTRVIGATHFEWDGKLFQVATAPTDVLNCIEMVDPLDFSFSVTSAFGTSLDLCRSHGFVFTASMDAYHGASPPPSTNNIQTRTRALITDDFGRTLKMAYDGDRFRSDDDVCVEVTYANPTLSFPRWLNAPHSKRVTDCKGRTTYAQQSWIYDGLVAGSVSQGHVTSHLVQRRATDNGELLRTVRSFDATYDSAGSLVSVKTERGADERSVQFAYEPFGLAPMQVRRSANGALTTISSTQLDPLTLDALSSTDPNQTQRGATYDGFGRLTSLTATPPGGQSGVRALLQYAGFAEGDTSGRRVETRSFPDPVPMPQIPQTPSRAVTTFLDELGRSQRTEIELGANYGNAVLVQGFSLYDMLGRIRFQADVHTKGAAPATIYGTTNHYKVDGEPACFVRGFGLQPLTNVVDTARQRFPTCYKRTFINHVDVLEVQDAASLQTGSPQFGVRHRLVTSAIGRPIEESTVTSATKLDHSIYTHDRLGQLTTMTRFSDPNTLSGPVRWSWRMDSIGQVLRTREPAAADRNYTYSDWHELVETQWSDSVDRRLARRFDAFSRLISAEETTNGVVDPATVTSFSYDTPTISPLLTPTFVAGRLSQAKSPSGSVTFSYDPWGNTDAMLFTDASDVAYLQRTMRHADGSVAALDFQLPDTGHQLERVKYSYDSADRLRSVSFSGPSGSRQLYDADVIDQLGRVRQATHGSAKYGADYSDLGRNLMTQALVESPQGARQFLFLDHDAVGRETTRREIINGVGTGTKVNSGFDALGRLSASVKSNGPTITASRAVSYDPLGNITAYNDNLASLGASMTYTAADPDRICGISYGSVAGPTCNAVHDSSGNITSMPVRNGVRTLSYFNSGLVRGIDQQGISARFHYDAFGQVAGLDVTGATAQDKRTDRRFGDLIERRDMVVNGSSTTSILRRIPGPNGILATRRGNQDEWIFHFAEERGNRLFTDAQGQFVQDLDYEPFGEQQSSSPAPGAPNYTSYQWNFGDRLADFGLSQLGARLYDPAIGRFLSRDLVRQPGAASGANPYAFARNDPVNSSDPSGLQPPEQENPWLDWQFPFGFGGGSGGGSGNGAGTPQPDPWNPPPRIRSGEPAISPEVSNKMASLKVAVLLGTMSARAASKAFRDFVRKEIYTNQHDKGGKGWCACAARQAALKWGGPIKLGKSYGFIKNGLADEKSDLLPKGEGQWEEYHFNRTVRINDRVFFSHPDKLDTDAILQVARNSIVGTGSTDRLKWTPLSPSAARDMLDEGALIVVTTGPHWFTMVRDPFTGHYVYLEPYAYSAGDRLEFSRSWETSHTGRIKQYHALVHE